MIRQLQLARSKWDEMRQLVDEQAPVEACGLLAGKDNCVKAVLPIKNELKSPVRFRMQPREQVRALHWIEDQGLELLGIFHSHPSGPSSPSLTDVEEAVYPVVHMIWIRTESDWIARGFWIENGKYQEIEIVINEE